MLFLFFSPTYGNKDFKTVQQADPKHCPCLITMFGTQFRLSHSLSNAKRFDAPQDKLVVIVINPQTLTWKLQDLQKEG